MAHSKDNWICILCTHLPLEEEVYFLPALLAAYFFLFFLHSLWQSCFACSVQDHEFLWGAGSSHQILLSRLQNRSEFHIKTTGTFGEVLCENQAARKNFIKMREAELKHCPTPRKTLDFLARLDFGGFFSQLGSWDLFSPKGHSASISASHPLNSLARSSKSDGMESWNY